MTKVQNFLYCLSVEHKPDKNNEQQAVISGLLPVISLSFFPSLFSFSMAFNILEIDFSVPHSINVSFMFGEEKIESIDIAAPSMTVNSQGKQTRSYNLTIDFRNVKIVSTGIYRTVISVDDKKISEFEIEAVEDK